MQCFGPSLATMKTTENFRQNKIIQERERVRGNNEPIPMKDVLSRLNEDSLFDEDASLSD